MDTLTDEEKCEAICLRVVADALFLADIEVLKTVLAEVQDNNGCVME